MRYIWVNVSAYDSSKKPNFELGANVVFNRVLSQFFLPFVGSSTFQNFNDLVGLPFNVDGLVKTLLLRLEFA